MQHTFARFVTLDTLFILCPAYRQVSLSCNNIWLHLTFSLVLESSRVVGCRFEWVEHRSSCGIVRDSCRRRERSPSHTIVRRSVSRLIHCCNTSLSRCYHRTHQILDLLLERYQRRCVKSGLASHEHSADYMCRGWLLAHWWHVNLAELEHSQHLRQRLRNKKFGWLVRSIRLLMPTPSYETTDCAIGEQSIGSNNRLDWIVKVWIRLAYSQNSQITKTNFSINHQNRRLISANYLLRVVGLKFGWTKMLETFRSTLWLDGRMMLRSPAVMVYQKGLMSWFWLFRTHLALVRTLKSHKSTSKDWMRDKKLYYVSVVDNRPATEGLVWCARWANEDGRWKFSSDCYGSS